MVRAGIVGASGYVGVELLRLLRTHPDVGITWVSGGQTFGPIHEIAYPHTSAWAQELILAQFDAERMAESCDVLFVAAPHGVAAEIVPQALARGVAVIDLGSDFRLAAEAVYGLTEWNRNAVAGARFVANPGCYPTATLLGLLPVLEAGLLEPGSLIVDAKSGVSGAGRSPSLGMHFAEVNENLKAYQTAGRHRHVPEIETYAGLIAGHPVKLTFTPHLVPMTRGILATIYFTLTVPMSAGDLAHLYQARYAGEPFIRLRPSERTPETKHVLGSNYCDISVDVDRSTGRVVAIAAIDNLVKGAAGQAVQNMNAMFGLPERLGLGLTPVVP